MLFIYLFVSFLASIVYSGAYSVLLEFLLLYAAGVFLIAVFVRRCYTKESLIIFSYLMVVYALYCIMQHIYRIYNHMDYIGSFDGFEYYIPSTISLQGLSFNDTIYLISNDPRYNYGGLFFLYFLQFASFSEFFHQDLTLTIQFSLIIFPALICVVQYHIFKALNFSQDFSYNWSLYFGLLSALFWLSSYIVRDLPIMLVYSIIIYSILSNKNIWIYLFLIPLVLITYSIRPASAFAAIPFLSFIALKRTKSTGFKVLLVILFVMLLFVSGAFNEFYSESRHLSVGYFQKELQDQGGNSTLSLFNYFPWGISHFLKLLYAQFHPFPAWKNMLVGNDFFEMYAYNHMRFPDIWVVYFRIVSLVILISGLLIPESRAILFKNKTYLLLFLYSLLLLLMQSMTIEERRKMIVYPFLFALIALFYNSFSNSNRKNVFWISTFIFIMLQSYGIIKLFLS